jgi:hypothetical protein
LLVISKRNNLPDHALKYLNRALDAEEKLQNYNISYNRKSNLNNNNEHPLIEITEHAGTFLNI